MTKMTDAGFIQVGFQGNEGMLFRQVFVARLADVEIACSVAVPFFSVHSAWFATVIANALEFIQLTDLETVRVKAGSFGAGRATAFAAEEL